jgi:hypothetical protein
VKVGGRWWRGWVGGGVGGDVSGKSAHVSW